MLLVLLADVSLVDVPLGDVPEVPVPAVPVELPVPVDDIELLELEPIVAFVRTNCPSRLPLLLDDVPLVDVPLVPVALALLSFCKHPVTVTLFWLWERLCDRSCEPVMVPDWEPVVPAGEPLCGSV
jgi:hypothetical protein